MRLDIDPTLGLIVLVVFVPFAIGMVLADGPSLPTPVAAVVLLLVLVVPAFRRLVG